MSLPKSVSLSFLDLITCGFGGVVTIFLVLVAFFDSQEDQKAPSARARAENTSRAPLLVIVQADTSDEDLPKSIWNDSVQADPLPAAMSTIAGTSKLRLVICAPDSATAEVRVPNLAKDAPLQILFYEGEKKLEWSGLYDDWPNATEGSTGTGHSLVLWPLPAALSRGFQ